MVWMRTRSQTGMTSTDCGRSWHRAAAVSARPADRPDGHDRRPGTSCSASRPSKTELPAGLYSIVFSLSWAAAAARCQHGRAAARPRGWQQSCHLHRRAGGHEGLAADLNLPTPALDGAPRTSSAHWLRTRPFGRGHEHPTAVGGSASHGAGCPLPQTNSASAPISAVVGQCWPAARLVADRRGARLGEGDRAGVLAVGSLLSLCDHGCCGSLLSADAKQRPSHT